MPRHVHGLCGRRRARSKAGHRVPLGHAKGAAVDWIVYEFGAAGGTETGGLSQTAFMNYWMKDGIEGVKATGFEAFTTAPADVRTDVRNYSALIVELGFAQGTYFGSERRPGPMRSW